MGTEDGTPEKPAGDRPGCLRSSQEDPRRRWRWRSEPSLAASYLFGRPRGLLEKQFKNVRHQERGMMSNPDHRTFFGFRNQSDFTALFSHPSSIRSNGRIPVFHIFRQSRSSFSKAVLNSCGLRARFPCVFESAA